MLIEAETPPAASAGPSTSHPWRVLSMCSSSTLDSAMESSASVERLHHCIHLELELQRALRAICNTRLSWPLEGDGGHTHPKKRNRK